MNALDGPIPTASGQHPFSWPGLEEATGVLSGADGLHLLDMPSGMTVRNKLQLVELASDAVIDLLRRVTAALAAHKAGHAPVRFPLDGWSAEEAAQIGDILGSGEVSGVAGADPAYQIAETVLPGLWRIRASDPERAPTLRDWLEVADAPSIARAAARHFTRESLEVPDAAPEGAMNVMPILAEVRDAMASYTPGTPNHVINFTLLPMSDVDAAFLARTLGLAPVTLISAGYGAATVRATGHRHVWSTQYTNSSGTVILDTLEIGDVPEPVRAADTDFEDSAARLTQILTAYR